MPALPSFFPFSFRFFLPTFYPTSTSRDPTPAAVAAVAFTPVPRISSLAAHALTNHVSQAPALSPTPPLTAPSPPSLTVPVRAHLRHTRSADHIVPPTRTTSSARSTMPYALPSPSPTVVLSLPPSTPTLAPSFAFPARPSPSPTQRAPPFVLVESSGPSRAKGPLPLIPRTSSASRLRSLAPGTLAQVREAAAAATAAVSGGSPSEADPSPVAGPSTQIRINPPAPLTTSPPRDVPAHMRHARRPPLPGHVSPPSMSASSPASPPTSTKVPVTLRILLDHLPLTRTLSEAVPLSHTTGRSHSVSHVTPGPGPSFPDSRSSLMIRKKSGELVKSSLRTPGSAPRQPCKSEPTTPSLGPKVVHFDAQLEHVKLFLAEQKPLAVSRDGSPSATEPSSASDGEGAYPFPNVMSVASSDDESIRRALVIRLLNMPALPNMEADVRLESVRLSDDARALSGSVVVRNIAFAKAVAVRFTLDGWQTTSEVSAKHQESIRGGAFDRFGFAIRLVDVLPRIEAKTMVLALRYTVGGQEIWDNNRGEDYRIEFSRKVEPKPVEKKKLAEWSVKSATLDQMADLRRELEKVVLEEMSPPDSRKTGKDGNVLLYRPDRSGAPGSAPPVLKSHDDSPLARRYNFHASLKRKDFPAGAGAGAQSSVPFPSSPSGGVQKVKHARNNSSPSGGVPFPRLPTTGGTNKFPTQPDAISPPHSRATSPPRLHSLPVPLGSGDLPRMGPRGSPRDTPLPAFIVEGLPSPDPPMRGGGSSTGLGRNHQRSYFDQWQGFSSGVRKTPPGTPASLVSSPAGRYNSYPPLSSPGEVPSRLLPKVSPPETIPMSSTASAAAAVAVPWAAAVPLPLSPPEENANGNENENEDEAENGCPSEESTPSGTETSSEAVSPMSPPEQGQALIPIHALAEESRDVGPNSYSYFLDRFCFYTGGTGSNALPTPVEPGPRRAHSLTHVPTFASPTLDQYIAAFGGGGSNSPSDRSAEPTPTKAPKASSAPPASKSKSELDLVASVSQVVSGTQLPFAVRSTA